MRISGRLAIRVLLVEDDDEYASLLSIMLEQDGDAEYNIDRVTSLAEAKHSLSLDTETYSVVMLDLGLPDSTGVATLEACVVSAGDVPIVVLTATADWGWRAEAIRLGAEDYVVKEGLDAAAVHRAVRHAAERRQLRLDLAEERERRDREREMAQLIRIAADQPPAQPGVAAPEDLHLREPEAFLTFQGEYLNILELAVARRLYNIPDAVSERVLGLAKLLVGVDAGPRDVLQLHTSVLETKQKRTVVSEAIAFAEEGRFVALELMGATMNGYRRLLRATTAEDGKANEAALSTTGTEQQAKPVDT